MKNMRLVGLLAALLLTSAMPAMPATAAQADNSKDFIRRAIEGNLAEAQVGKLAQTRSRSDKIKQFGAMLESDHTKANEKAIKAANALGVTPPTSPNAQQRREYDSLGKLQDSNFERTFLSRMVADHEKDINEYKAAASAGGNDPAARYATEALPTLEKHLKEAQGLKKAP